MRGTWVCSQVNTGFSLHRISSFLWRIFTQCVLPCCGKSLIFVLWGTTLCGMCKLTALSVNHAGKHSKDCFRGAVFVDTLAGKLDMWLCMAESVQVNLSKMELGGDAYLLSDSLHLCVPCDFSASPSPFTSVYIFLSLFLSNTLNYPRPPPSPAPLVCSPLTFCPALSFPAPLLLLPETAVARQQLIEHEGYAIDQLEVFQMKSGVKSSRSYS